MSNEHKAALASGRNASKAVKAYLEALEVTRPRRGRRPSPAKLEQRLAAIEAEMRGADVLQRLYLTQERKDVEARLAESSATVDMDELEAAFVGVAAELGAKRGISYATWRECGVPAEVLQKAGIARSA